MVCDGPRAMFPLSAVLFPYGRVVLRVFEPRYRALVADCLAGDGRFGVVLITRGSEVGGGDERAGVGTLASIEEAQPFADGRWHLVAVGRTRIRVTHWLDDGPYPRAAVEEVRARRSEVGAGELKHAEREVRRVRALLSELGAAPSVPDGFSFGETPDEIAWALCGLAPVSAYDRQRLLEASDHAERLTRLVDLVGAVGDDARRLLAGG
jgi:uncharacterized protein